MTSSLHIREATGHVQIIKQEVPDSEPLPHFEWPRYFGLTACAEYCDGNRMFWTLDLGWISQGPGKITASVRVSSNSPGFGYRYDIRKRNVRCARTLPTCLGEMEKAMTALLANADAVDLLPELVQKKTNCHPLSSFSPLRQVQIDFLHIRRRVGDIPGNET